jgi:putative phage-type endonuclease
MMATKEATYRVVDDGTDRERWLRARSAFIGASEGAAILGLSKYSTPLDVWNSKQPGAEPIPENRFMTWGNRLESVVADWAAVDYADILGEILPSPGLLASIDYPFISATPDRVSERAGVIEIKTGGEYVKKDWFDDFTNAPAVPIWYETQVQQQEFVMGLDRGHIVPFIGGNDLMTPRFVPRDDAYIDIMLDELASWREKYLLTDTPPPATRLDDLKALFPGRTGESIDATPLILQLVAERNVLQPESSALTKRDKEIKGDIQAFMGNATELIDPSTGETVVTWRKGLKATIRFDETQFAIDHAALYQQYLFSREPGRTTRFV